MLLIAPPLVKSMSPLLGIACLAGDDAGVEVLDLNLHWLAEFGAVLARTPAVLGDHDRSVDLTEPGRAWSALLGLPPSARRTLHGLSFERVLELARGLADGPLGRWVDGHLPAKRPQAVGLSVLYAGQVVAALAIGVVVRWRWPGVQVIWGGPHVTALAPSILGPRFRVAAGEFVTGYAAPDDAIPRFEDLAVRSAFGPITLPAQMTRGCSYGRCTYCTYPAIEGRAFRLPEGPVLAVLDQAAALGAHVAFKDSLMVPRTLRRAAELSRGRVRWAACTKISSGLTEETLADLHAGGLRTLEIGLETLSTDGQVLIQKRHPHGAFERLLDSAGAVGVGLVVNYMTGLPGVDPVEEAEAFDALRGLLDSRSGQTLVLEHNTFEYERLAPATRAAADAGARFHASPWSSVVRLDMPIDSPQPDRQDLQLNA